MTVQHDEACEADWGAEGQESPCRCGQLRPAEHPDPCLHGTFSSRYVGRGVYRHECKDCGEVNNVDAREWDDR